MSLRIVFMGSPSNAVPALEALLRTGHRLIGIVAQPDRPAGRGQEIHPPAIAEWARARKLPLFQPDRIKNNPEFLKTLQELSPDLVVVVAYGRILPNEILTLPPKRCLNLHFSLLPKYRGAAPVQWALINGEEETGVTTFQIVEKLDAGPIYLQKKVLIEPEDNAEILGHRLAVAGADLLVETVDRVAEGRIEPTPQNDHAATPAPPLKKEDGRIDWSRKAKTIWGQIRGTTPWPGAFTFLDNKLLKVYSASVLPRKKEASPGEVLTAVPGGLEIACGQGALLLKEVQIEGKKRMKTTEFLKGHPIEPGKKLGR